MGATRYNPIMGVLTADGDSDGGHIIAQLINIGTFSDRRVQVFEWSSRARV